MARLVRCSSFGGCGYWGEELSREKRSDYEDHLREISKRKIIDEPYHEMADGMTNPYSRARIVLSALTGIAHSGVAR